MQRSNKSYRQQDNKNLLIPTRNMKRSDNFILLLCIIIAAFFWLLIKLANVYDVSYEVSVSYKNIPVEKRMTHITDTSFILGFNARGYDILKLNVTERLDRIDFEFEKELNQSYKLFIEPGAIEDILGIQNDTIQSAIKTGKISDYCSIFITMTGIERFPAIVHLINEKGDIIAQTYATGPQEFEFKNLRPGRFKIRIIYDDNENLKWDTGDFLKNIQPEQVYYVKSVIEAKANWEVEENIQLRP